MATSTAVVAMIGPCTSSIAFSVDSFTGIWSLAICSSTFSMTTIASSTTMPMASTSAKSVSVLMVKPSTTKVAKVPMMETGTARIGMRVVRHFWSKTKTTRMTRRSASMKVSTTSEIDALIKAVLSTTILYSRSGGKSFFASARIFFTAVTDSSVFSSFVSCTPKPTPVLPSSFESAEELCAPVSTSATSRRRTN